MVVTTVNDGVAMRCHRWATIVLIALATACGGPDETDSGGGRPAGTTVTTTVTPATADPTATTVTTEPSDSPSDSPSGPNLWFEGIWPDSRAGLDEAKAAFDQGDQPWRADPVATARAYLLDLGLAEPVMGPFETFGGRTGSVHYQAGPVAGAVQLRMEDGNPLPYVVRLSSARAEVVRTEREGDILRVEVASLAPGILVARAGTFGSEWQDEQQAPAPVGPPVTFTLAVEASPLPLLLEVRHEGEDGMVGIARLRVQPSVAAGASGTPAGDPLSAASRLRPDGIGPIDIGMTHDQALAAAGVPLIVAGTEYCGLLRAVGGARVREPRLHREQRRPDHGGQRLGRHRRHRRGDPRGRHRSRGPGRLPRDRTAR